MTLISSVLDFEDQTANQTVSLSGSSDWSIPAQHIFTATPSAAAKGTLGAHYSESPTGWVAWTDTNATAQRCYSWYMRIGGIPTGHTTIAQNRDSSGGPAAQVRVDKTTGKVSIRDGYLAVDTTSAALGVGTLYRFEWLLTTNGQQELRIFEGDDTSATFDISGSVTTFDHSTFNLGLMVSGEGLSGDLDCVRVTDDWAGPYDDGNGTYPAVTVWDGSAEVDASVTIWDGTNEVPATVGVSGAAVPPASAYPGDPGTGVLYYGSCLDGGESGVLGFENDTFADDGLGGRTLGIYRGFYQSGQVAAAGSHAADCIAHNRLPLMSFKVPGNNWAAVGAGSQDSWLESIATAMSSAAGPVWICLHHEPYNDGAPADYRAMYARAGPILHGASNVAVVPILNSWIFLNPNEQTPVTDWDVSTVADVVSVDCYPNEIQSMSDLERRYDPVFNQIAQYGKPMALSEYASRTTTQGTYAVPYMSDIYTYCLGRGDVVAMMYFNSTQNVGGGGPMTLTGGTLAAFTTNLDKATSVHLSDLA
ncbi:MAG: hypothetical protein ACRDP4_08030 [Nocardioidaceae bacterium]